MRWGDALAVAPDQTFIAEKKTDPLRKIPSIFVVVPNEADDAAAMDIDTDGPKVRVSLSKPNYEAYTVLRQARPLHSSLNSMIVIPALIAVLESIRRAAASSDGLAAFESRRWYATLSRRLKELGIDAANVDSFSDSTPAWMYPFPKKLPLTYHADRRRWRKSGRKTLLRIVDIGQEFVLDTEHYPHAHQWLANLFKAAA